MHPSIDKVIDKAYKVIATCRTREQLNNCKKFLNFIKARYPSTDMTRLEEKIKNKDKKLFFN